MDEEISMRESIEAGAPDIKYNRGDIRMGGREPRDQGKEIAAEIWSQMEPEQKVQFQSFEAFFMSGIWKEILKQLQQDQSGIRSQAPNMSMSENVNMAEMMPGGGIADVDVREKVAMAANGGLMGLYNRGM
tara:strand:+ start:1423 stop:1815 length:393 start_codon:yes stop_codon:yes gene_type:complete